MATARLFAIYRHILRAALVAMVIYAALPITPFGRGVPRSFGGTVMGARITTGKLAVERSFDLLEAPMAVVRREASGHLDAQGPNPPRNLAARDAVPVVKHYWTLDALADSVKPIKKVLFLGGRAGK
ncbi:uncharacterized protein PSFLO_01314 [Pseudozyma flocculosa]|uniref:Uncharacterized protein n=1 Tax=Pseudozyma flocculosa TaxID=84751 RepID=A0A5C3EU10_9BASI|nr:uncharacterized protein PSFLO_01314 [Pseudozyma flocculosa]